jgi:hypothetical protein
MSAQTEQTDKRAKSSVAKRRTMKKYIIVDKGVVPNRLGKSPVYETAKTVEEANKKLEELYMDVPGGVSFDLYLIEKIKHPHQWTSELSLKKRKAVHKELGLS